MTFPGEAGKTSTFPRQGSNQTQPKQQFSEVQFGESMNLLVYLQEQEWLEGSWITKMLSPAWVMLKTAASLGRPARACLTWGRGFVNLASFDS